MQRLDLLPDSHRAERELLLDLLSGATPAARFGDAVDARAFLSVIPEPLYPFVYSRLRPHAAALDAPKRLLDTLAAHHRGSAMLAVKRRALLRMLLETLERAGIEHLVLKGPVLAYTVFDDPATRTMADIDLLVRAADQPRAFEALEEAGCAMPRRFEGFSMEPGDSPPLIAPGHDETLIELHSLLDSTGDDADALERAWSNAIRVDLGDGLLVPALAPGDFFTHVAMHASKHHRFDNSLRSMLDVALLLRSSTLPWPELQSDWKRLGIDRWMTLTITLAHHLFGVPLPPDLGDVSDFDEALPMAAAQLWQTQQDRLPQSIVLALAARRGATPVHAHLEREAVAAPRGVEALDMQSRRLWSRLTRLVGAFRRGALRPHKVRAAVGLFKQRESLAELMEEPSRAAVLPRDEPRDV